MIRRESRAPRRRKPVARGPQGLPIQRSSPQRQRPAPKPTPSIHVTRVKVEAPLQRRTPQQKAAGRRVVKREVQRVEIEKRDPRSFKREEPLQRRTPAQKARGKRIVRNESRRALGRYGQERASLIKKLRTDEGLVVISGSNQQLRERLREMASRPYEIRRDNGILGTGILRSPKVYFRGTRTEIPQDHPAHPASQMRAKRREANAEKMAPVLTVLEQTTRPLHGAASGTRAAIKGGNVPRAVVRGLQNKDKSTFSDVLKDVGVKNKAVAGTVGFALDIAFDPLTYMTGGISSVGRQSAIRAGKQAYRKSLSQGLTKEQARRMGERASKRVAAKSKARGVELRFAGKALPGVTRATAAAGQGVSRTVSRSSKLQTVREQTRLAGSQFNPRIHAPGMTREQHAAARQLERTSRMKASRSLNRAQQLGQAVRREVGEDNYRQVIDAIESGRLRDLPAELRPKAKRIRDEFRYYLRQERQAGIATRDFEKRPRPADVPEITADPKQSFKELQKARRRQERARRSLEKATRGEGVAQGRAEVLSRNVGGVRAERAAERAGAPRAKGRYAAGGYGVTSAKEARALIGRERAATDEALEAVQRQHELTKTQRREQAKARKEALEFNETLASSARGYVPHVRVSELDDERAGFVGIGGIGKRVIRPPFAKSRGDKRPIAMSRGTEDEAGKYLEDLNVLLPTRGAASGTASARATINRKLGDMGREVRPGTPVALSRGETLYHIKGGDIVPIEVKSGGRLKREDWLAINRLMEGSGKKGGKYVALPRNMVEKTLAGFTPMSERTVPGVVFDRAQGTWKFLATVPNPGFHVRNTAGDLQNAYLAQPLRQVASGTKPAGGVIRRASRREQENTTLEFPSMTGNQRRAAEATEKKLDLPKYGQVSLEEISRKLEEAGAIRGGFIARELPELLQNTAGESSKVKGARFGKAGATAGRWMQNREDMGRAITAINALKKGATYEEAAQRAADFHFDYSELTPVERKARRLMPFYTFSARNIPLQARSLLQNPAKFAQYQKVREELAKAFGVDLDQTEKDIKEYEQRAAPIVVKWKGKDVTFSLGPSGLPLTDLSEIPHGGPIQTADEWMERGLSLVTPGVKTPIEVWANLSSFFREPIQRDESPLVTAPKWVAVLPRAMQREAGVVKGINKRTGKPTFMWPAKVDYVVNQVPGPVGYINRVSKPGEDDRTSTKVKTAAWFGLRIKPTDPVTKRIDEAYTKRHELDVKLNALGQQGISKTAGTDTPEYNRILQQRTELNRRIYQLKKKRGDKILPRVGAPPKRTGSFNLDALDKGSSIGDDLNLDAL